ncbi:hypothetical protein EV702DRAFT_1040894 [Suillus placidus]|uniref:Uncharacterized protein n=1 Tax=Suillus placidus TaxID=48579 RepID=A0A9P7D8N5_9AGAM|nr:hypothetical protein EV702DRAFT_1040894 [Suillus placidus]
MVVSQAHLKTAGISVSLQYPPNQYVESFALPSLLHWQARAFDSKGGTKSEGENVKYEVGLKIWGVESTEKREKWKESIRTSFQSEVRQDRTGHRTDELILGSFSTLILAYATGGWKFMILMGGNDPSTGEVSVFNYHVGELESGVQFDQTYTNFDVVQAAFLMFVKDALTFESTLPQDSKAEEAEDSSSDLHDGSDEEWAAMSGNEHGGCHVEEEDLDDLLPNSTHQINTVGMYRMTPQSESFIEDEFGACHSIN